MLSAQATDRSVNLATKKLFPILQKPEDAIKLKTPTNILPCKQHTTIRKKAQQCYFQ